MPELPEVETVRLQLLRKISQKTIKSVVVYHPKTTNHDSTFSKRLTGKIIAHIDRVGKLLIFSFNAESNLFVLAHLKMTGQFFFVDSTGSTSGGGHSMTTADGTDLPHKHTRVSFTFTDNSVLYFNDMRLFGYTKLASKEEVARAITGYGPEPIDPNFDVDWFTSKLKQKRTVIKAALLNQKFIAGLGNIYVDEALWAAKVCPSRRSDTITKKEAVAIAAAAGNIMRHAITIGGTTFQHFADTGGDAGNYSDFLQVFGKQGTSCPRCGTEIKKIRCAGRGTHYCPSCQK